LSRLIDEDDLVVGRRRGARIQLAVVTLLTARVLPGNFDSILTPWRFLCAQAS
jgi:hypothetical protein